MKKFIRIFSVLLLACCLTGLFAACGDNSDEQTDAFHYGNYYLIDDVDSYIFLSDETILFHNVDFSNVEKNIFDNFDKSIDVAEVLSGEQPYDTNVAFDRIYVQIYDIIYLTLHYDSSEKSLSMIGQKFVLQEGISLL